MADQYIIRGGREGYERLQLLARDRWPDTAALFERAGLCSGMRCVDLGCGGGEVTLEMASLVAPGVVTGIDMDEVKLRLAHMAADNRQLSNVEFRALDVDDWDQPDAYDIVYSRFLLQHLSHPVDLLRRMWSAVRTGGALIVEDADFDGWFCNPPNEGFEFFLRTYSQVLRHRGGDHAIGRKLHAYFLEAGIPRPDMSLVQSLRVTGDTKTLAWSTLDASADAIASEGITSPDELKDALSSLAEFTEDPDTLIGGPRIFQLCSRR